MSQSDFQASGSPRWAVPGSAYLLTLLAAPMLLMVACSPATPNARAPAPVAVQVAMPVRHTFHARVAAVGQLVADSRQALSLSLPQAGQIVNIRVVPGQRVERGDVLLKIRTDPRTRGAYLQAQAGLKAARENLARAEHLRSENLATNGEVQTAHQALTDAQATLAAQAKLGGAQTQTTLNAPADGIVTALGVSRGQRVAAGATLLEFTPGAALVAQLGIDPGAVANIHPGMSVTLEPVYAAQGAPPLHGTVTMVGGAVNPRSHLVDVIATLDSDVALSAGSALSATIQTTPVKAWAVPRDALQSDAQGDYVFQIEDGKAHRVNIKVVAPAGSPIGIDGALDPHAPVITLGSYGLSDGDAVKADAAATP